MDRADVKTELSLRMDPPLFATYELRYHLDQLVPIKIWESQSGR